MGVRLRVDLTDSRVCGRCGSPKPPIGRHHMGNDAWLGQFNKRIAFNYPKFLDCVHLCLDHHCEIHYLYDTLLLKFWVNVTANGAWHMRRRCIKFCQKWLAGAIPSPTVPEKYRERFTKNFEAYKKAVSATEPMNGG